MYLSWKLYKVNIWPKPHMQSSVYTEPFTFKYFVRGWREVLILQKMSKNWSLEETGKKHLEKNNEIK